MNENQNLRPWNYILFKTKKFGLFELPHDKLLSFGLLLEA